MEKKIHKLYQKGKEWDCPNNNYANFKKDWPPRKKNNIRNRKSNLQFSRRKERTRKRKANIKEK